MVPGPFVFWRYLRAMTTPIERASEALSAANQAFTLLERIAAALDLGNPTARASRLRRRAVNKRRAAAKARTQRRRMDLLADAAAFDAKAEILAPSRAAPAP